jgi:hypothetical protein
MCRSRYQGDNVELGMTKSAATVSFIPAQEGTDLGPAFIGLPDDSAVPALGIHAHCSRLEMRTKTGTEVYEAGDTFYWPSGHVPVALTDCEYVDFSPSAGFAEGCATSPYVVPFRR